ncbi:4Fe-4S binding protein [Desulfovibrio cuneatus]|uniref:4Fe-4S binding protein n=1 Tax=Desulfovibrio cuneatus TaxID=159728 RepID=UPI0006858A76|nr:4Fe-4S binding protein [Desulfovibrio cuneatus]
MPMPTTTFTENMAGLLPEHSIPPERTVSCPSAFAAAAAAAMEAQSSPKAEEARAEASRGATATTEQRHHSPAPRPLPFGNRWYVRLRRPVQCSVFMLFLLLPWLHSQGFVGISGSLYALNVFNVPFADPVSAMQALLGGLVPFSLWAGAGIVLLLALLFGRVFCGWLCPFGLLSEVAHTLRRRFAPPKATPPASSPPTAYRQWFRVRTGLCLLGIILAAWLGFPVLNSVSLPGELSLLSLQAHEGMAAVLVALALPVAVLLAEVLTGKRLWCRVCPQAACLALAAACTQQGFGVAWNATRCTCPRHARMCEAACSLQLPVRRKNGPPRSECVQCGDCVTACAKACTAPQGQALHMGFEKR